MKKIFKITIITVLLFLNGLALAQNYNLLEPLPNFQGAVTPANPEGYIESLYWYAFGLAVALSVLMLIVGGLEYTTAFASESNKGAAKARIENAVIGLIIALTSYLILFTVNPDMATFKLKPLKEACPSDSEQGSGPLSVEAPVTGTGSGDGSGNYTLQLKGTGPTSERYNTDTNAPSSGVDLQLDGGTNNNNDFQLQLRGAEHSL